MKLIDEDIHDSQHSANSKSTFLPGTDPLDTVAVAKRLYNEGMKAVPHLAARSLKDFDQLDELLVAYRAEAGVSEVLVIGGGVDQPVGAFDNNCS